MNAAVSHGRFVRARTTSVSRGTAGHPGARSGHDTRGIVGKDAPEIGSDPGSVQVTFARRERDHWSFPVGSDAG